MGETVKIVTRPIICLIFVCSWTVMIFLGVDYPDAYWIMACLAGLEWISERAIKRFKEIFGKGASK